MVDLIRAIVELLHKLVDLFKRKPPTPPQETSERVTEVETEEKGDLTMIADKMLERLHKRKK